jgi:hypothetical protein
MDERTKFYKFHHKLQKQLAVSLQMNEKKGSFMIVMSFFILLTAPLVSTLADIT